MFVYKLTFQQNLELKLLSFGRRNILIPKELVIQWLKGILENNSVKFGNNNFLQMKGTTMETKVEPTYATLNFTETSGGGGGIREYAIFVF